MNAARARILALLLAAFVAAPGVAHAQVLYWLDTHFPAPALHRIHLDGTGHASAPLPAGTLPEGLALDSGGKLYWAEAAWSGARLMRAAPTLASVTPLLGGGAAFRGIAIDDVNGFIYWTSSDIVTGGKVHRAALDGSGATMLIALGPGANPRGIAVDPAGGFIYWADFGLEAIYRATLAGAGAAPYLAFGAGTGPWGVALDVAGDWVYWAEYGTGQIRRANLTGGGPSTVRTGLAAPTYLALDVSGNLIFWAESAAGAQRLAWASIGGGGVSTIPVPLQSYGGIAWQPDATVSQPLPDLPAEFALEHVRPNPASGPVHVAFALPVAAQVRLAVYDLQGREVGVLADGVIEAGRHERQWGGAGLGSARSGVYFARFSADGRVWSRRFALLR